MGDLNHVKGQKDKGTGAFQGDAPAHFGGTGSMPRTGKVGRHAMPPTQGAYRGGAQAAGQNAYAPASSFDGIASGDGEKTGGPRKAVLIALGVIVALLAIAYAAGVFVFHERFYPQTTLGALDISMNTHQEASSALAAIASSISEMSFAPSFVNSTSTERGAGFECASREAKIAGKST